jgi:glutathione peroxidase-family protein
MKKLLFAFCTILFLAPVMAQAQSEEIKKLYEKYRDLENVVYLNLNTNLFKSVAINSDKEVNELMDKIKGITILTLPSNKLKDADLKAIRSSFNQSGLEEIISIRDGKDNFKVVIREKNGIVDKFMILAEGDDEFVVMDFNGSIPKAIWDNAQGKMDWGKFGLGQF